MIQASPTSFSNYPVSASDLLQVLRRKYTRYTDSKHTTKRNQFCFFPSFNVRENYKHSNYLFTNNRNGQLYEKDGAENQCLQNKGKI